MAQRKPVLVDDAIVYAPSGSTIIDLVPEEVYSVTTHAGALIPREMFARVPIPDGFETNLSPINKGLAS
jgi:hypothetical protein